MIDTAGTITKAADALMEQGAVAVVIAATHAILSGPAVDRLKACKVDEVVVTNTLPIPEDAASTSSRCSRSRRSSSMAIKEVFEDGSVTSLFDGKA